MILYANDKMYGDIIFELSWFRLFYQSFMVEIVRM